MVKVAVDPYSGLRAGPGCPGQPQYFIAGTEPKTVCTPEPPDPFDVASPADMIRSTADRAVDGIGRVLKAPLKSSGTNRGKWRITAFNLGSIPVTLCSQHSFPNISKS